MRRYAVSGIAANTATTVNHAFFALWVPAGSRRVGVVRITSVKLDTAGSFVLLAVSRISARGTPGSTVTPTIVSDVTRELAPTTGALLDLSAYSVQPTLETPPLESYPGLWGPGACFEWDFSASPLWIDPGAGVCVHKTTTLVCAQGRVTVEFVE